MFCHCIKEHALVGDKLNWSLSSNRMRTLDDIKCSILELLHCNPVGKVFYLKLETFVGIATPHKLNMEDFVRFQKAN